MSTYSTNTPEGMAKLEEMIARQNKIRGFDVTQVDKELLLERIKWKDWSAYFLGEAFCNMYRPSIKHNMNLTGVCELDAEGKNFLFKIIFARDVPGWSCDYLYRIEQEIKEILKLEYVHDEVVRMK
jgi:hypothetical protein